MARLAVLLRGVNVGGNNRLPMAELRSALAGAGFTEVASYLQSGNVVLSGDRTADSVARRCEGVIRERFGLDVRAVVRTREELAAVVGADPIPGASADPRRYQVTFLEVAPDPGILARLAEVATPMERFAVIGREIYAWHPEGVARSRLATLLAGRAFKVAATARNWTTVTALLSLTAD
jgi:uncharacterized protein (DUF1697 family)